MEANLLSKNRMDSRRAAFYTTGETTGTEPGETTGTEPEETTFRLDELLATRRELTLTLTLTLIPTLTLIGDEA